jgi:zinc D-Ala-D-Ala carboxypeptidase
MTSFTEASFDRERWPNFSFGELKCSHTGACVMDESFLDRLQSLRDAVGSLVISSGYRSESHPVEAAKDRPGTHTMGRAVDVVCRGERAYQVLGMALELGFTGIGVDQGGDDHGRFLHLDDLGNVEYHGPRPTVWSY